MFTQPTVRFSSLVASIILLNAPCAHADFLYLGARSNFATRVDETTGNQLGTFADGFYVLHSLTLGPDGTAYVAGGTVQGQAGVYRFNPVTGQSLGTFLTGDDLDYIRFGPDGKFYGLDEFTDNLIQYNGSSGSQERVVLSGASFQTSIGAFGLGTHNDVFASTGFVTSKLARYDLTTGQQVGPTTDLSTLGISGYGFDQMTIGPDGKLYVTYSYHLRDMPPTNAGVMRFDLATGNLIDTVINGIDGYGAESGGALGIAFGPDGNLYIGSQHAKAVFEYSPATWSQINTISLPGIVPSATYLRFLPVPEPSIGLLMWLPLMFFGRCRRVTSC